MKKKIVAMMLAASAIVMTACSNNSNSSADVSSVSNSITAAYSELQEDYAQLQNDYNALKAEYDTLKEASLNVTEAPTPTPEEGKIYGPGETWTVDGLWSLTINSATTTSDRNQFSDKNPAQVIILDYTYQNIGYEGDFMDLYISDNSMDIIDSNGELASSYPGSVTNNPQETPVGATCANAQVCIGLNNQSSEIQITVDLMDNEHTEHTATFKIPIQ